MSTPKSDLPTIRNYSINLMWINATPTTEATYICPDMSKIELSLRRWRAANPNTDTATINLWYDSETVTPGQIKRTIEHLAVHRVTLKNIREIEIVNNNPFAFSMGMSFYVKIDMLKLAICADQLCSGTFDSTLFTDIDIGDTRPLRPGISRSWTTESTTRRDNPTYAPRVLDAEDIQATDRMGYEELFDRKTMDMFKGNPLILGRVGEERSDPIKAFDSGDAAVTLLACLGQTESAENQFIQMYRSDAMIKAVKSVINNYLFFVYVTALQRPSDAEKRGIFDSMGHFAYQITTCNLLPILAYHFTQQLTQTTICAIDLRRIVVTSPLRSPVTPNLRYVHQAIEVEHMNLILRVLYLYLQHSDILHTNLSYIQMQYNAHLLQVIGHHKLR